VARCSEEYPEFVNQFNDIFALLVDGVNVATLPGTNTPVSINTVNAGANSQYFVVNYVLNGPTVADGFTTLLNTQRVPVSAGQTLHLKLAIADTADDIYDSWVMISGSSLVVLPPECDSTKACCNADGTFKAPGSPCRYVDAGTG
jgi:hypothetical protein